MTCPVIKDDDYPCIKLLKYTCVKLIKYTKNTCVNLMKDDDNPYVQRIKYDENHCLKVIIDNGNSDVNNFFSFMDCNLSWAFVMYSRIHCNISILDTYLDVLNNIHQYKIYSLCFRFKLILMSYVL